MYDYLHGEDPAWNKLRNFEWRSSFGTWLTPTAHHRFIERKKFWIDKGKNTLSIDDQDEESGKQKVQLPEKGEEEYIDNETRVLMFEAILRLRNKDQRFAVMKQLEGYCSKEIAELLKMRWKKHGIVKYGFRKVEGQKKRQRFEVVPNEKYVDSLLEHARKELKLILNRIM